MTPGGGPCRRFMVWSEASRQAIVPGDRGAGMAGPEGKT